MTRDQFNRPLCPGWGPTPKSRCGRPVHPGYCRCPHCDRPYSRELMAAALEHPQNESFRRMSEPLSNGPSPEEPAMSTAPADDLSREELTERFYELKSHLTNLLFASRRLLAEASANKEDGRTVDWTIGSLTYERIREAVREFDDAYAKQGKGAEGD